MTTPAQNTRHRSATVEPLMHAKPIPLRLTGEELERAWAGAQHEGRSASNFIRMIHNMGMEQYAKHGRIVLGHNDTGTATAAEQR